MLVTKTIFRTPMRTITKRPPKRSTPAGVALHVSRQGTRGFKRPARNRERRCAPAGSCFLGLACGTLGDFRPGNGIVAQALLSVSRRSARLHPAQRAAGSSPPKPLAWDRSRARPVGDEARRSIGNRKECRLRHDYASFPGPQTPSSLRAAKSSLQLLEESRAAQRRTQQLCSMA